MTRARARSRKALIFGAASTATLGVALASCTLVTDLGGLSGETVPPATDASDSGSDSDSAMIVNESGTDADALDAALEAAKDASVDANDAAVDGGVAVLLPTSTGAVQAVLGFPTDTASLYYTFVDDGPTPNDDTDYVRSRGNATTTQFATFGYDALVGKTARAVDVTYRAKRTPSAVCTPSVILGETASGVAMTLTGAALVADTYTTQTLHFALATPIVAPSFTTQFQYNNDINNAGQCYLTAISIAVTY